MPHPFPNSDTRRLAKQSWFQRFWLLIVVCSFLLIGSYPISVQATPFISTFERGWAGWQRETCCSHSANLVNTPARLGQQALRFEIRKGDPMVAGRNRSEVRLKNEPGLTERWYGLSLFRPTTEIKDPAYEVVTQWQAVPDQRLGESWRTPPLSLNVQNGRYGLVSHWDTAPVSSKNSLKRNTKSWDLGAVAPGQWTDFVVHAKWSYRQDGFLEVWRDGHLLIRHQGPTYYNDQYGPMLKVGLYKAPWSAGATSTTTRRVMYVDEVRSGDHRVGYQGVSPGNRPPSSTTVPPGEGNPATAQPPSADLCPL